MQVYFLSAFLPNTLLEWLTDLRHIQELSGIIFKDGRNLYVCTKDLGGKRPFG